MRVRGRRADPATAPAAVEPGAQVDNGPQRCTVPRVSRVTRQGTAMSDPHGTVTPRRRRAPASCAGGVALALTLAACGGGSDGGTGPLVPAADGPPAPTATASATPSPTPSPTPVDPKAAVLAQYDRFWATLTPADLAPPALRRGMLAPVAEDPALTSLLNGMAHLDDQGQVFYGRPTLRPAVRDFRPDRRFALVFDCQDTTRNGDADHSGNRLTVGMPRDPVEVSMNLGNDGLWRVSYIASPKGQPC